MRPQKRFPSHNASHLILPCESDTVTSLEQMGHRQAAAKVEGNGQTFKGARFSKENNQTHDVLGEQFVIIARPRIKGIKGAWEVVEVDCDNLASQLKDIVLCAQPENTGKADILRLEKWLVEQANQNRLSSINRNCLYEVENSQWIIQGLQ